MFQQQFANGKTEGKEITENGCSVKLGLFLLLFVSILERFVHTTTSILTYIHSHMVSEIQLVEPLVSAGFWGYFSLLLSFEYINGSIFQLQGWIWV